MTRLRGSEAGITSTRVRAVTAGMVCCGVVIGGNGAMLQRSHRAAFTTTSVKFCPK